MSIQDKILIKLIEIQEDVNSIKVDMKNYVTKDEFLTRTDQILTIVSRLDNERIFTDQRIARIEKKLNT